MTISDGRSQRKPSGEGQPSQKGRYRPLVAQDPLPIFARPTAPILAPLDEIAVQSMLASPSAVLGKLFFFEEANLYYHIMSIEWTVHARIFRLQYDGVR